MTILYWTLFIVTGFLSGSILYCKIIPKLLLHKDICEISDDHNPGAVNVFKHCGVKWGLFCLLLDVLKGFVPVLLASIFMDSDSIAFTFVMVAPALGHAVGIFNRFHGGKCISVSFGIMFGIMPVTWIGLTILAVLYIFFSVAVKIKPHSRRSILVFCIFGVASSITLGLLDMLFVAIGCLAIAVIAVVKHAMELVASNRAQIDENAQKEQTAETAATVDTDYSEQEIADDGI